MKIRNNFGFTVAEAVLFLVIIVLVGLVGYKVYNTKNSTDKIADNTTAGSEQAATVDNSVPSTINSTGDLDQAQRALDQYDSSGTDNNDLSQLDSELSAF